jgi:hypothetical protein
MPKVGHDVADAVRDLVHLTLAEGRDPLVGAPPAGDQDPDPTSSRTSGTRASESAWSPPRPVLASRTSSSASTSLGPLRAAASMR